jgi:uncharacterized protein (TIGR03435 family)
MRQLLTRGLIVLVVSSGVPGQSAARPAFEVASVKPNRQDTRGFIGPIPAGKAFRGFAATGARLKPLIMLAYGVSERQLSGAPSWADSDAFDIDAKAESPASYEQILLMLQTLLEDRFQLKLRRETREESGYALVLEKDTPNPLLHANDDGAPPLIRAAGNPVEMVLTNIPMGRLAWILSGPEQLGRPVVDKTGLLGGYDFKLEFSRISSKPGDESPHDSSGPSLVAALKKVGFKLVSQKVPSEFLTIEHVEKPSSN